MSLNFIDSIVNKFKKPNNKFEKLYHISEKELNTYTLEPRIPNNVYTQCGFEDKTIKRICFSPTIDGCLIAVSNDEVKLFNVYEPESYNDLKIKIPTKKEVIDCEHTNEVWVLNKIKLKKIGVIKTTKPNRRYRITTKNFTDCFFIWDWEWVKE